MEQDYLTYIVSFEELNRTFDYIRKGVIRLECGDCHFYVGQGSGDFVVKLEKLERGYRFRYGKYAYRGKVLVVDCELEGEQFEELFYEKLPVMFCYQKMCEDFLKKCLEEATSLSEFESEILKKSLAFQ